ncbi:hypothetical protein ABPG75_004229 [Micractinium tetrahymenae]
MSGEEEPLRAEPAPPAKRPRLDAEGPEQATKHEEGAAAAPETPAGAALPTAPTAAAGPAPLGRDPLAHVLDAPMYLLHTRGLESWATEGFLGVSLRDLVSGDIRFALVENAAIDVPFLLSACPDLRRAGMLLVHHAEPGGGEAEGAGGVPAALRAEQDLKDRAFAHAPPLFDKPPAKPSLKVPKTSRGGKSKPSSKPPKTTLGAHNSKLFLLEYEAGLRVVVTSAGMQYQEVNLRTQVLWFQDFPPKDEGSPETSDFEQALSLYLAALKVPAHLLPESPEAEDEEGQGEVDEEHGGAIGGGGGGYLQRLVCRHDFSAARADLVPSVPGNHRLGQMEKYGRLAVREVLKRQVFPRCFERSPIAMQVTSLGDVNKAWLEEGQGCFKSSLSAGRWGRGSKELLYEPRAGVRGLQLVWPLMEDIKGGLEGFFGGTALTATKSKLGEPWLAQHLHKSDGSPCGRERAVPCSKLCLRYAPSTAAAAGSGSEAAAGDPETLIAWACLGSHNLSGAAWGRGDSMTLQVHNWELSVLLTPRREAAYRASRWRGFSCTGPRRGNATPAAPAAAGQGQGSSQPAAEVAAAAGLDAPGPSAQHTSDSQQAAAGSSKGSSPSSLVFTAWQKGASQEAAPGPDGALRVPLPIPFALPPQQYRWTDRWTPGPSDTPWAQLPAKEHFAGTDIVGMTHQQAAKGRSLYGWLDSCDWSDVVNNRNRPA